jgi:hypothetical protein
MASIELRRANSSYKREADMKLSNLVVAVLVIAFLRSTGALAAAVQEDAIAQYLHSAGMVKSYDVTFQATLATYSDSGGAPALGVSERVRDASVDGGRRYERYVGDPAFHTVSARLSTDMHRAREMMLAISGMNYRDYFDPFVGIYQDHGGVVGSVLTELLQDPSTQIRRLEMPEMGCTGFELLNPKLTGSVRLWLDPANGSIADTNRHARNRQIRCRGLLDEDSDLTICPTRSWCVDAS